MRPISMIKTTIISSHSAAAPQSPYLEPRSPWHSPVPYLFGGLAAMLGLIAFALLILACSYWKISTASDPSFGDEQNGEKQSDSSHDSANRVFEEKVLVIMAGEEKPTFLATPAANRVSTSKGKTGKMEESGGVEMENGEKVERETEHGGEENQ